ncbi:MAG: 50S ribosomal protein L30 [Clostridiales bacterium]|nr:50S ribosomal protein L30 [Clostridiales bacterium]
MRKTKTVVRKPERELEITLVRSLIGCSPAQRAVASGLGLRKRNSRVIRKDGPEIWGMIRKIPHLVKVEAREKK